MRWRIYYQYFLTLSPLYNQKLELSLYGNYQRFRGTVFIKNRRTLADQSDKKRSDLLIKSTQNETKRKQKGGTRGTLSQEAAHQAPSIAAHKSSTQ